MSKYVDFSVLFKVLVIGLGAGAGVVAIFALGIAALAPIEAQGGAGGGVTVAAGARPAGRVVAVVCFGVVALAMAFGISVMLDK